MGRKTCTPFCDPKKTCPKHHDLLIGVINCSDRKDSEANVCFEYFKSTVKAHRKKGWNINDVIPDPVRNYRFPLVHWAGVMGKVRALEWMINFGFDVTVRSVDSQETALHRSVLCLHFSNTRRNTEKVKQMVHLLKDCLPLQDKALQTPLHAAATKLITGNKADYYSEYLKVMVAKAMEIPGKTAEILNARDQHGNTAMHYLAQNEIGIVPLNSIISAGGDVAIVNKKKLSALDVAMNNGSTRIIKALNSAGKRPKPPSCYDNDVYSADSPPESPVNLEESKDTDGNTDTPVLECCEDSLFSTSASDASNEVSSAITATPCDASSAITAIPCDVANVAPSYTSVDAPASAAAGARDEGPQAVCSVPSCDDQDDSEATVDALSVNTDEAGPSGETVPSCETDGRHLQEICASIGVQTPVINPYSCTVHIKQERLSPCEKCQQESMGEISSSSEMQSITTTDMANSVITLLRGAGLLDNLTEIAEKRRIEDEHVLTDKLEMVKETNNELESRNKEIEEKKSRIETLSTELEELKQQVEMKVDERERLMRKRKLLNDECNSLQRKLHCCDSLLKVVPKVNLDNSNV